MEGSTSGETGGSPDQLDRLFGRESVNFESLNGIPESRATKVKKKLQRSQGRNQDLTCARTSSMGS